jgi:hypothetical protein
MSCLFKTKKNWLIAAIRSQLFFAQDKNIKALFVGIKTAVSYNLRVDLEIVVCNLMPHFLDSFDQTVLFQSWNEIW